MVFKNVICVALVLSIQEIYYTYKNYQIFNSKCIGFKIIIYIFDSFIALMYYVLFFKFLLWYASSYILCVYYFIACLLLSASMSVMKNILRISLKIVTGRLICCCNLLFFKPLLILSSYVGYVCWRVYILSKVFV